MDADSPTPLASGSPAPAPASNRESLSQLAIPKRSKSGRGRWLRRLLLLVAIGAVALYFSDQIKAFVARARAIPVEVLRVSAVGAEELLVMEGTAANGYVVASRRAALSADTPGRIVELNVTEGSLLNEGDIVARLYWDEATADVTRAEADVIVAEARVAQARAQLSATEADLPRLTRGIDVARATSDAAAARLELAELDLERVGPLVEDNIRPESALDQARTNVTAARADHAAAIARLAEAESAAAAAGAQIEASRAAVPLAQSQVDVARAVLEGANARLDKTFVRAPFDGIVVLKDAEIGEVVSPNSQGGSNARGSVATMVDLESLEVQAEVPETSLAAVEVGKLASVYLDAFPNQPYPAKVDRIWPTANRQKATVEVRVAFDQRDTKLRPEMGVRVVFLSVDVTAEDVERARNSAPLVLVQGDAIAEREGTSGVFLADEESSTVRFHAIEVGPERAGRLVIESGLEGGERIVAAPPENLADGAEVKFVDSDA